MAKKPSRWSPKRLLSWLKAEREESHQRHYKRIRAKRLQPFESLEDREMMAILVNLATTSIQPDAPAIVIQGSGFDPIVSNLTVEFNDGQGTVTAATDSEITVQFATPPSAAGALTAIVRSLTEDSGAAVQVATVVPKVTASTANLAANATTLTINGSGFSSTPANNTIAFNNGAMGTVSASSATSLTVNLSTGPTTAGPLTVQVTTNGVVGTAGVQVARVIPVITSSSTSLDAGSASLTISGYGFDPTAANNVVDFDGETTGTVTAATATSMTVTFDTEPNTAGDLLALVTTGGISANGSVKVATVVPVITSSTTDLAANASTVTINGFGFGATAGSNTVVFNNGAVGTVTSATANVLNITLTTKPTAAGALQATVTANGVASATLVQISTVIPVVTRRTVSLGANATTLTINGFGFDTTIGNNTVVLDRGAAGTVSAASATTLTVDITTAPTSAGSITAIVTTNSASSGTAVQVANVTPVVTSSTASVDANATTLIINGFGFSTTAANNSVQFSNGAVGTVTGATASALTVTINTAPTAAGSLTAVVTTNSVSSGTAIQVATIAPVVTANTNNRGANSTTVIINGFGFSTVVGNNTVTFDNGAVGTVTSASATSLTVTYSTRPTSAGNLNATVTTNGVVGSATQIATITPVVTSKTTSLAANATSLVIYGFGFDPTSANNSVVLTNGAVGTVLSATATTLNIDLTTGPTAAGSITAVVTSNSLGSGNAVQIASVRPVVTSATTSLAADSTTVTINGFGFDTTNANNVVTLNNGAAGTVTNATATSLEVTFSTKPTSAGSLTAVVKTNNILSGSAVQVATVIPAITSSTANLNANASTITIQGFGFDTTAGDNVVTFDKGAVGSVIAATPTSLTVRFTTIPTSAGALSASVATDTLSSGSPVQVATVIPVVSDGSSSLLAADATSVTILGFGFDSTAANNTVTFVGGAAGTVASATATTLVVNLTTKPTTAGLLTASVTTNSESSGTAVAVAKVTPVVSLNAGAVLSANASTIQIVGLGFDTTPGNNTVVFDSGAIGAVTTATASLLTVTFSTKPTAGDLKAVVISNGVSNGSAIKVSTVKPTVTSSTTSLAANATRVTISGSGFDTTATNNTVVFNNGAIGTVTAATATTLTVTFSTKPTSAGDLSATVTTNGVSSGATTQVATVTPVVTSATTTLSPNSSTVTLTGLGFDPASANNIVDFNNGAIGTVTTASATSLTVTFSKKPRAAGSLTAQVTSNGVSSGSAVQISKVTPLVLANSSNRLAADTTTLTINGLGFDATAANNTVVFSNGAIGHVTTATSNALTIALTKGPNAAGALTAIVTTNTVSSGAAVQVAFFAPVVTSNAAELAADATSLTINGFGFDKTAANNSVSFDNGAVGVVTAATTTSLTVTFSTKPTTADELNAVVTTNGIDSGAQIQVATVTPVVTEATANLPANSSSVVINGFGFSSTISENSVVFNNGAVGTVTAASPTQLTVTLSQKPSAVGSLTAIVTTKSEDSGSAVQVADVSPVVTSNNDSLAADATSLTIYGFGFDTTAANNTVVFDRGAVGTITAATATTLTVSLTTTPTEAGSLTAIVTTNDIDSGAAVQVVTVKPIITSSTADLAADATSIVINGSGFSSTPGNNTVVFDNGASGTVTTATNTAITVTFSVKPTYADSLNATVTTNGQNSDAAIQVATVTPVITSSTADLPADVTSLVIDGLGFDPTPARNTIVFNNAAVGVVTAASATALTVSFTTKPQTGGSLTAVVTSNGISSGATAVQVAKVIPVVVANSSLKLNADSTTLTINGIGFDTTAGNNLVTLNNGAVGTVGTATATTLTVNLTTKPTAAGSLTAVVTSNAASSGSPTQVATVAPVVTSATTDLPANGNTILIYGFGFDATAANNSVVFSNGAVGTVTASNATTLLVTFTTKPTSVGNLTAVVTTNAIASGSEVQVATVKPVVTSSTANLAINASQVVIAGFGFDTTASRNEVVFNNGAIGTVTNATATALTVTFAVKPTSLGNLTAVVTTNAFSSAAAVQIATVTGGMTSSSASRAADETTLTINGYGFDITAGNNTVTFSSGAVGTVTSATANALTVTFSTKPTAGSLTATVSVNGVNIGTGVTVATVKPVVTSSDTTLAANAATVTISGVGFSTTPGSNTVVFNNSAVGVVTAATATTLTVSLSTKPTRAGSLTAIVTTNAVSSGSATQVAEVKPVVTAATTNVALNATTVAIVGFGFDSTAANNTVVFNNGAVGNVSAATATSLTVTITTAPSAGALTAVVTSNDVSSGTAVQVASLKPVVTATTTSLAANLTTLTIAGSGFDPTAANNTVSLSNGAVGTVSDATPTSLTVTITTQPIAGVLNATVTTNAIAGSVTQVATINPVVTASTANMSLNGTSLIIGGFGFNPVASSNSVTFVGTTTGRVTAATATSLTVLLTRSPAAVGALNGSVTTSGRSSGVAVQLAQLVANSTAPVVTATSTSVAANTATLTITGTGFSATPSQNTVTFNNGATGTVTAATTTSLTVSLSSKPTAGNLTAIVATAGVFSGPAVQVATVNPVVSSTTTDLTVPANTLTISGFGFDARKANNLVSFNLGAAGTVISATATSLTVRLTSQPTASGSLTAVVTTNTRSSGAATQVARVAPSVTVSAAALATTATTVVIRGLAFNPVAANNSVTFNNGAVGTVTAATATSLTVTFGTKPSAGKLTAVVTTDSISSGAAVQIAIVAPVVTAATANLLANTPTVTISGTGFSTTAADNTVTFNNGAIGTVTAATATSLTVTLSSVPRAGALTAIVTTNTVASGAAVQVATIVPIVTSSTANLAANGATLVINGFGFAISPRDNVVTFNNGAVGTVISATATAITVSLRTKPSAAGSLSASVTSSRAVSGTPVQVATVKPVVLSSTSTLSLAANTIVIRGFGFSTTLANNSVVLNNGAVGTVTSATATALTVTFGTKPTTVGDLTAVVTSNSVGSGDPVKIAGVTPTVTLSNAVLALNPNTITINGAGFDTTAANNIVSLSTGAAGTVIASTSTSLTVLLSTRPSAGILTAVVTINGISSGTPVRVATLAPIVTLNSASIGASTSTLTINGFGFSTTAANNTVTFNNGAIGTVTTATATALTVNLTTRPTTLGNLTAVVTTNGASSGTPVQVANVTPVVTVRTNNLSITASSIIISGFGFSSTLADNTVTFNNGAVGTITRASATSLTIRFSTKPVSTGSLTAIITTRGVSSGAAIQVATVT
jgi:hypothetical protein